MTALALDLLMPTLELVGGFQVVVELPNRPGPRVMATLTSGTELQQVLVVLFMTAEAIHGSVLVTRRCVTGLANDRDVFAQQGKTRQAVVEPGVLPVFVVVAFVAACALLALVLVIL